MANWAKLQEDLVGLPVAKRAKHGIHFQKGANEFVANFSGKPCHYEDGGIWKPIDTKLLATSGGFYGSPHSDVKIHPDGRVVVDKSDYQQFTKLPSAKAGKLAGDRVIREFPGGEQHLIMKEDGFKEEIHVFKPTFPLEKFIAKTTGNLPSKYKAHSITAEDADGNTYEFTGDVVAFGKWLDGAKYPVVIDPDFAGGTADARVSSSNADYAIAHATAVNIYTTATGIVVGQTTTFVCARGFLLFDTSSIGAGSTVTQVNLKLTAVDDDSNPDFNVVIQKYDWGSNNPITTTNKDTVFDGCLAADADDNIWRNTSGMSLNTQYTSGNLSTAWVSKTGTTYYGLISSRDLSATQPSSAEYCSVGASEHGTESRRPVLTVTYTASGIAIPVAQYYYNRLRRN